MTALAWPAVALVLGLVALRIAWEVAISQRRTIRDVSASVAVERSRLDLVAGIVDTDRTRVETLEARIAELEDWRRVLRNRNGGRD